MQFIHVALWSMFKLLMCGIGNFQFSFFDSITFEIQFEPHLNPHLI